MFDFIKKHSGFTLAELMVTLGLIGAVAAITIPSLAYNYRAKVLEEQYRSTYSELKEMGSAINYEKGDVGEYANKATMANWTKEFIPRINGMNNLVKTTYQTDPTGANINTKLKEIYKAGGGGEGPYAFNLNGSSKQKVGVICDNYYIWSDSKGRIWTFNSENRIICVDINGSQNPNRLNIDIFAFIPMTAEMVATYVYNDPDNTSNYSGQIIPCDLDKITRKGWSNTYPKRGDNGKYDKTQNSALSACPFFNPLENVAPTNGYKPGKSARNYDVTSDNNYWRDYINYK